MMSRFEKGEAYWGTATIDSKRKKVYVVTARHGRRVSFAHVNNVRREMADSIDGVEIVKVRDVDGLDYFLSARVPVDIDAALEIAEACR